MSTSPSPGGLARAAVLRGGVAASARPARLDADLRTSEFAGPWVDPRLTDPILARAVEAASTSARAQAREEGYAEGLRAGRQAAAAEAAEAAERADRERQRRAAAEAERLRSAEQALTEAAALFRSRQAVAVAEVEDTIAAAAVDLTAALLDRELAVAADPGREAIARALALLPETTTVTLRLHPDDVDTLATPLRESPDRLAPGRTVQLVADPDVERGGCVADSADRHVDAQLWPALARVRQVLT